MDAPLPGHLYYDRDLHNGHYFIVGPDDPVQTDYVIVFCCTSKEHGRPRNPGCHAEHDLPSFFLEAGAVPKALTLDTWVILDEFYYYAKTDFETKWQTATTKLPLELTADLLDCAGRSDKVSKIDAAACRNTADVLWRAVRS